MISVKLKKDRDGAYLGYECRGHAGYARAGEDIVCAAVSMLSVNTANAIEALTECEVITSEGDGILTVSMPRGCDAQATLLMRAYEMGLRGVMDAYNDGRRTYLQLDTAES